MKLFESKEGIKLLDIYTDLANNITKIYNRPLLHMGMDLVFYSCLEFTFKKQRITRGWLDILIIGDTRTGKTAIAKELIIHNMLGEFVTGENITKAGLVGGLQQINGNWMINWGKLPINDRRLVILDEVSGMSEELISELSGIRSSGIAEIIKIRSEKTLSRVRLIWLANPRGARNLSSYTYPVVAVKDLIIRPEDIARFDYCLVSKTDDVPLNIINAKTHETIIHKYTKELCNKNIMWVWSRKNNQIQFTKAAEELVLDTANYIGKKYSPEIPLIEPNEARIKIARIAIAIAGRLFSTDDGINLIIKTVHIDLTKEFIDAIYQELGYDYYSKAKQKDIVIENQSEVQKFFHTYGEIFVEGLLDLNTIKIEDIFDLTSDTLDAARSIIAVLVKNRCIKRHKNIGYIKTPAFIQLLKQWNPENYKGDV